MRRDSTSAGGHRGGPGAGRIAVNDLNYHHLYYFWMVAREGSIARACEVLDVAQPTISAQIRKLERSMKERLFERVGRGLALTESGAVAFRYADEIFTLGREMQDTLSGRPAGHPLRLTVGVVDALPKLVVWELLEPALRQAEPMRVVCLEGPVESLVADLAMHRLDVVLSDTPLGPGASVRAFNHQLGECGVSFFARPERAEALAAGFPDSIDGQRILLPTADSTLRRSLEHWFESRRLRPVVAGEFADSALLKAFGQAGYGLFAAPTVIEKPVCRQYEVAVIGRIDEVREQFFAISIERRLRHPALIALSEAARRELFS